MAIQELTKELIIEELVEIGCISGQMLMADFIKKVCPEVQNRPTTDFRFGMKTALDDIAQHMDRNDDWTERELLYDYLEFHKLDDYHFKYFLEQYVQPNIRRFKFNDKYEKVYFSNSVCVEAINKYLTSDGYELKQTNMIGDAAVYSIVSLNSGVAGPIKNIIFASQYKPEIVISNALNNDITIINNEEKCLVYNKMIKSGGITWKELKEWYEQESYEESLGTDMITFMRKSMTSSKAENVFFDAYLDMAEEYEDRIPALFPQVWLYYDPKLKKDRIKKIFEHQRMDFLMLFSESQRVVIEIDGKEHYANKIDEKWYACTDKYAEMMSAQRDMSLAGYDVYRFGGKELYRPDIGKKKVYDFLNELFSKYGIVLEK